MFKKTATVIVISLIFGVGALHASSTEPAVQIDSTTPAAAQVADGQVADGQVAADHAVGCQAQVDTAIGSAATPSQAYECPVGTSYCQSDSQCDASNGEVCERGCCRAAF